MIMWMLMTIIMIVMVMILKVDHVKYCLGADDVLADDCEGC